MPFASGAMSFQRFVVVGNGPSAPDEALLEKLEQNQLAETEISQDEENYGWCGGAHLFDDLFSFEHNVFNDAVHFGLRLDTNKPPGDLKKAYIELEQQAAAGGGFLSKAAKKDATDAAMRKLDDERKDGRFRKSKFTPLLWDVKKSTLYGPSSATLQERLFELFDRTFGLSLIPMSAGELALRQLEKSGKRREYEDMRPTSFSRTDVAAEYPWVAKGPQAKNFLGNELLAWLWYRSEQPGVIETEVGEVDIAIEKMLDLDCVFGETGRDVLRGDTPTLTPEARHALRTGKVPRKLTLMIDGPAIFNLTLNAESFGVSSLNVPDIEDADSPRVIFEERITHLRDFSRTLDGLLGAFLKQRTGDAWAPTVRSMREWVAKNVK